LPGVFYLYDDKWQLLRWNKTLEKFNGYSTKEIPRKQPLDFVDEGDKSRIGDAIHEVFMRGEYTVEADLLLKDGKKIPYFFTGSYIKLEDIQGFVGMGIDISQRLQIENALQQSEEKFRSIFNNARDGILLADIETKKFMLGNAIICQMLGYGVDELMTMGVEEIHPVESLSEVSEHFEKLVRQETSLVADIPVKRKDGSLFFADINSFFLEISGKTYMAGFFSVVRPIMTNKDNPLLITTFADVLREMDIEFLVSGEYGILVEEAANFLDHPHFLFLDVRTKEERDHLASPFAYIFPSTNCHTGWTKCPGTSSSSPFV
jgi:PAS domain S-box-containing protein